MDYEEKLSLLDGEDFFTLFFKLQAEPRWVTSAGKRSIQLIGKCHHGDNHSALFDPSTFKVNCFSECGRGMQLHTWVKQALDLTDPQDAKDFIEDWIDNQEIDFSNRIPQNGIDFEYKERPYEVVEVPMVEGIQKDKLKKYLDRFDKTDETLTKLVWHKREGIDVDILKLYEVMYYTSHDTIILPHHNINGEIVGMYERSFRRLRKEIKKLYPDMPYKATKPNQVQLLDYPRAKYVPLLRDEEDRDIEEKKTSWSFPNSQNLYGLHLALDSIKTKEKAIIFEGGKSVMLARQYGYPYAVATHTFGAHLNHISMLINAGAKEIILAFDKQYKDQDSKEWDLYEKKTKALAEKIKHGKGSEDIKITRIIDGVKIDNTGVRKNLLEFKDSPIDHGPETFKLLFDDRESLTDNNNIHEIQTTIKKVERKEDNEKLRIMKEESKGNHESKADKRAKLLIAEQERRRREKNGN